MPPKASICIPTFNQAQFLDACLVSALGQDADDYEVVLSVNHCTDNTEAVLRKYADSARLRIVRPERFLSAGENFRFVVSQARGEYVNFVSSDDVLYPSFLSSQLDTLDRHPNVAFSFTAGELVDEHGHVLQINRPLGGSYIRSGRAELERYIFRMRATGIALLIRRSAYEAIGGLSTEVIDWEACVKLLCVGDVAYQDSIQARVTIWSNSERVARRVELIKDLRDFYEDCERFVTSRYPELGPLFAKARSEAAMGIALAMPDYSEYGDKARAYLLALSATPAVQRRLFAVEALGLGPFYALVRQSDVWLRLQVKKALRRLSESARGRSASRRQPGV